MRFFHQQSRRGGLLPRETTYLTRGSGTRSLRFSKSGFEVPPPAPTVAFNDFVELAVCQNQDTP